MAHDAALLPVTGQRAVVVTTWKLMAARADVPRAPVRSGLGEIRGLTFCEGTITDLTLKFPEFVLLGVWDADALDVEPVD